LTDRFGAISDVRWLSWAMIFGQGASFDDLPVVVGLNPHSCGSVKWFGPGVRLRTTGVGSARHRQFQSNRQNGRLTQENGW